MDRALSMFIEAFLWCKEYHPLPRNGNSLDQKIS